MAPTLREGEGRGGGGGGKNENYRGRGLASVLDVQSSYFLVNKSWVCAMTRHYANNMLLAKNLPFDSEVGP